MKYFCLKKRCFSRTIKALTLALGCLFLFVFSLSLSACKKSVDYFEYVSELRNNIFLAETDGFSLRAYAMEKEYPYLADGVKRETSTRTEVYLLAPSGDKNYQISFTIDGKEYGGEMSFDNVKAEYYYSCSLDVANQKEICFIISYGEDSITLNARSVLSENTLTAQNALQFLLTAERELFEGLTDKYGFAGEIYLRLIFEEKPYYYIGVIDKNGNTTAFLLNGETGKILAKRSS